MTMTTLCTRVTTNNRFKAPFSNGFHFTFKYLVGYAIDLPDPTGSKEQALGCLYINKICL